MEEAPSSNASEMGDEDVKVGVLWECQTVAPFEVDEPGRE
jgi:hypothetical protein